MKRTASIILSLVITVSALLCVSFTVSAAEPGPAIKTQPQSVTVNYPDGATFKVVPQNPDEVASYQWYFVDMMDRPFKLDGTSAVTDTLVCPAIDRYQDGQYFYCELTGKNGGVTRSAPAYVTVPNYYDVVRALYVGNYAVKCGESLDLSKTELGSGIISYSADGKTVTLNNVYMDNTDMIVDHTTSIAISIMLDDYATDIDRLDVKLIGNNTIKNTFYQESMNSGGITFDLPFLGLHNAAPAPDVHVNGSGSLTLIGGSKQLNTTGDLYIEAPVKFLAYKDYFCDAINAENVTVAENVPLTFDVNGTLIYAKDGIDIKKGASVNAKTTAPFVMNDYTNKNGFLCTNDIIIKDATVKIELAADPARHTSEYSGIATLLGINNRGRLYLENSRVEITETAGKSEKEYFYNGGGISCGELELKNSVLSINVNSDEIIDSYGINAKNGITVTESVLNCFEHTSGRVFGIAAGGDLKIKNSTVIADCASSDDEAYGIMYKTVDIDLNSHDKKVEAKVNKGFAMGANIGNGKDVLSFDEEYKVAASKLGEHTVFSLPLNAVFNQASMNKANPGSYIYIETPYSKRDKTAATHIVIECDIPSHIPTPVSPDTADIGSIVFSVLLASAAALVFLIRRRKAVFE